jgi:glycosyl-4,4'-diaponeurosporenoate acyltransferase
MLVPPIELAPVPNVVVDVGAWFVIHAATGYAVHRLPLRRLQRDNWLLRPRNVERGGRLYERLGIRRWKDALPEAGALFPGGVSKRTLPTAAAGGLERFAAETRRAELGHWLAMAGSPLFVLWNPPVIAVVMMAYGVTVNAPFIAIQRYNRARASRCLERASRLADSSEHSTSPRRSADITGNSIP